MANFIYVANFTFLTLHQTKWGKKKENVFLARIYLKQHKYEQKIRNELLFSEKAISPNRFPMDLIAIIVYYDLSKNLPI